jgi:acetyltransferase
MVKEHLCYKHDEIITLSKFIRFPVVIKVLGPLHKTEVNGVTLNVNSEDLLHSEFDRMMKIPAAKGVLIQPMVSGEELYCGAAKQGNYGHLILAGLGGIYVEVLKDISYGLAPLNMLETTNMIQSLKGYEIIKGYRNREGVNEELFADAIMRIASLVSLAPEISELDINPFRGNMKELVAVDVRIKIDKSF